MFYECIYDYTLQRESCFLENIFQKNSYFKIITSQSEWNVMAYFTII